MKYSTIFYYRPILSLMAVTMYIMQHCSVNRCSDLRSVDASSLAVIVFLEEILNLGNI